MDAVCRFLEFYEYPDGSGYEGRFTKCGICVLMKELGLYDLTPALCRLDYTMSEAGGVTNIVRQYTLASGGPYCDCGYKRKGERTLRFLHKFFEGGSFAKKQSDLSRLMGYAGNYRYFTYASWVLSAVSALVPLCTSGRSCGMC